MHTICQMCILPYNNKKCLPINFYSPLALFVSELRVCSFHISVFGMCVIVVPFARFHLPWRKKNFFAGFVFTELYLRSSYNCLWIESLIMKFAWLSSECLLVKVGITVYIPSSSSNNNNEQKQN